MITSRFTNECDGTRVTLSDNTSLEQARLLYIPLKAVHLIALAANLRMAKNPTFPCNCPICSYLVTIPITSREELLTSSKRAAFICFANSKSSINGKLFLIRFVSAPVS